MTRTRTRILHLVNNFADSSISRIVERIICGLGNERYAWHVGALDGDGEMEAALGRLGVKTAHFSPRQAEGPAPQRLGSYVRQHGIQIVHTHTPRAIFAASLNMPKSVAHIATKHLLTTPKDRRWGPLYTAFDYLTLYLPNRVVPVSETMAGQVRTLPGMANGRVTPVRNGIPCEMFYRPEKRCVTRETLGLRPDQLTFGYAGRLDLVKRLDLLIEAFAAFFPTQIESRLLLVGDGAERAILENQARRLGLKNMIIFTGQRSDMPALLAAMDVYVQSSLNEGLSLSILEAMAAGKAVIATDVGGAREVIGPGKSGLLVPPGSVEALTAAMLELSNQPVFRLRMGETARHACFEKFSNEAMVAAYEKIYLSLLQP